MSLSKYFKIFAVLILGGSVLTGCENKSIVLPCKTIEFVKATEVVSGGIYAFWADNKVGTAFATDRNFGYIGVANCTPAADGIINASVKANGFIFTQTEKGWTIQNPDGRYLMMTGSYNSIDLSATLDNADNGYFWNITIAPDGTANIENVEMKKTMQYDFTYHTYGWYFDEHGVDDNIDVEGAGTKASPYNCAAVIALNNPGTPAWVKGYIVGYYDYNNNSALVNAAGSVNTCVALADDPNETDKTKTVAVQLPVGEIREAVNLQTHPENLGKKLAIQGDLAMYFGLPGIKAAIAYNLEDAASRSGNENSDTSPSDKVTDKRVKPILYQPK